MIKAMDNQNQKHVTSRGLMVIGYPWLFDFNFLTFNRKQEIGDANGRPK